MLTKFVVISIASLIFTFPVYSAEPVIIDETLNLKNISQNIDYVIEKDEKIDINEIIKETKEWKELKQDHISLKSPSSRFWFRLSLNNTTEDVQRVFFQIEFSEVKIIEFYVPDKKGVFTKKRNGMMIPPAEKEINYNKVIVPADVLPGVEKIYIRLENSRSELNTRLLVMSYKGLFDKSSRETSLYWIYFGLMIVMILYNLFIFFSVRDLSYLYYVFFIGSWFVFELAIRGFLSQYSWVDISGIYRYIAGASFCAFIFWLSIFLASHMGIKDLVPKAYFLNRNTISIPSLIILVPLFLGFIDAALYLIQLVSLYLIIFYIAVGSNLAFRKKHRTARIVFLSFSSYFITGPAFILSDHGIIQSGFATNWGLQISASLATILLSFSLADRINIMKRELQKLNLTLEVKVQERTKELEDANERLKEMDHIKSNFFANISHEIRTPLTLILSPVESILQGDYKKDVDRKFFENIQRNAIRLLRLINNILDFSKLEAGRMKLRIEEVDIVKIMKNYAAAIDSSAESKGININFSAQKESINLYIDISKADKAAMNLFSNALKFTGKGGKIDVRISEDDANCIIEVEDTGEGIPEEKLDSIFNRFTQVDSGVIRKYEGTGIGLALAKEMIDLQGGKISVKSRHIDKYPDSHGTVFYITIPKGRAHLEGREDVEFISRNELSEAITDADTKRIIGMREMYDLKEEENGNRIKADAEDKKTGEEGRAGAKLLVVEDNADMRSFIKYLLKEEYTVFTADNGVQGLEKTAEIMPDVIITDVMMPGMNGYEMTKKIKGDSRLGRIPVLMLTAKADITEKIEGLEYGADDYLTKPFNSRELLTRVKSLLKIKKMQDDLIFLNKNLEEEVKRAVGDIEEREYETLDVLGNAAEYRDPETASHIIRVAEYSKLLAGALGESEETQDLLYYAAPLHDIGKIGIPDSILLKEGKLTTQEFDLMKNHCLIGYEILKNKKSKYIQAGAVIALTHHERCNGSGYPYSLLRNDIHIYGRIVAVVDVFDALTSKRPYKEPLPFYESVKIILEGKGELFDPLIVEAFINNISTIKQIYNRIGEN